VSVKDTAGTPHDVIVKAVRKWVFIPAMKGGEVVPAKISIPFSFDSQSRELTDFSFVMGGPSSSTMVREQP
jgi:hypothetical protein